MVMLDGLPLVPITRPSRFFTSLHYISYPGAAVTDKLLGECAALFSESYGVWGQNPNSNKGPKPGLLPPFGSP